MKRCTATLRTTRSWEARRWASHDKSTLSKEALQRKVEAGLGHDADGKPLRVEPDTGTVYTAAGDLPLSPVLDPSWIKSRRRQRKDDPRPPTGRLRKKLPLNPFAQALATPIRYCGVTRVALPRYFLQDLELVKHPTTGEPWYAPGPLAFEHVVPRYRPAPELDAESPDDGAAADNADHADKTRAAHDLSEPETSQEELGSIHRPRRAPLSLYALNRKDMLDELRPGSKQLGSLFAGRTGAAWSPDFRRAVWRSDLSDVILGMMRRTVTDALIARVLSVHGDKQKFVEPVRNWEALGHVQYRQSVLWLPREDGSEGASPKASEYATVDVDNVAYYRKMPVHNLSWMLGSDEVARLKESAPVFAEHEILVLKHWGGHSMLRLQLLLWRMHGYLARTPRLPTPVPGKTEQGEGEAPPQKTKQPREPWEARPVQKLARKIVELMPKS